MAEKKMNNKRNTFKKTNRKSTSKQFAKRIAPVKEIHSGGEFSYKMPAAMIEELLKNRKGAEAKMPTQDFLCDYVNEQYGLIGKCVKVLTM